MQASDSKLPPNLQPTLTGEHICVRPIAEDDWSALFQAAADPLLWADHPAKDRYQEAVFRDFFTAAIASGSAFVFVDKANNQIIGSSRYYGFDAETREIEIGWTFIARSHWGGAANRVVKTLMLNHAFTFADTVVFWVGDTNHRSRGAMEKLGGVLRPDTHFRELAGTAPHVIYEIRKASWKAAQGADS